MNKSYEIYRDKLRRLADVHAATSLMNWDQEIYMPSGGAAFRAQQISTLSGIAHDMATDKELGKLLQSLAGDESLGVVERKNVNMSLKDYNKQTKLPTAFVEEMSRAVSEAFQRWQSARKNNDFNSYAPALEKLVALKLQEAEYLGYEEHPYDALIDYYEPGITSRRISEIFGSAMPGLKSLLDKIASKPVPASPIMVAGYPKDKQWDFSLDLLRQMHYDFDRGRQDISTHPFTIHFNPDDVRVTTRIAENDLAEIIWSTIHEGGHALYEQGIPAGEYGLPSGEYISLGIHESQSRLWENNVGRSKGYWKNNWALLNQYFPDQLKGFSAEDFYREMNLVKPSLIRTAADELTYHFHIYIRFLIEKELMEKQISVKDLPARWNGLYKEYLGVNVPSDSQGVLQDIHWSHGSFGYFPTYSLGSFYAAQFFEAARQEITGLTEQIGRGELKPLLDWLRVNIHQYGKQYTAEELCKKITGKGLDAEIFLNYAAQKYEELYQIN